VAILGKNGDYMIQVALPATGKKRNRHRERFHGTRREAEKRERELKTLLDAGRFVTRDRMTLGNYLRYWLENEKKLTLKEKTYYSHRDHLHHVFDSDLDGIPLQDLTADDIQAVVADLHKRGRASGTIKNFRDVLRSALNRAVQTRRIPFNPVNEVEIPRIERGDPEIWTQENVKEFLSIVRSPELPVRFRPHAHALELIIWTGLRRGEVCGLRWSAVDLENAQIYIGRTRQAQRGGGWRMDSPKSQAGRRMIELTGGCVDFLRHVQADQILARSEFSEVWPDDPFVVCYPDGTTFRPDTLTSNFREIIKTFGLPKTTVHKLRHVHATMLNELGFGYPEMAQRLGHSSVQLTMQTYTHIRTGAFADKLRQLDSLLDSENDG
jgi:integrase